MSTETSVQSDAKTTRSKRKPYTVADALDQQKQMTPVERFSRASEVAQTPAQEKYYRDLIPLEKPAPGEQYRFEVDLDSCFGCKSCVSACHHQNGLETEETWRSVGLLLEQPVTHAGDDTGSHNPVAWQHLTTACHHCVEPACMIGCPTNAYEKDPATGVVYHLDDQCFGCQYCVMACPYQVPQYSAAKGIVRKCDMCHDRLAADEAPACVQACPSQAIRIGRVEVSELDGDPGEMVVGAPPSSLTRPATRYTTQRDLSRFAPASQLPPIEHGHPALVVMLVLTQLSVGSLSAAVVLAGNDQALIRYGFVSLLVGMVAATLHLGRPLLAYRGVLGWRDSWLSREAIAFGGYTFALSALLVFSEFVGPGGWWFSGGLIVTTLVGWAGVICSAKIYEFTKRPFWAGRRSWLRFAMTTLTLGAASALLATNDAVAAVWLATFLIAFTPLKLGHEFLDCTSGADHANRSTRRLIWQELRWTTFARFTLAFVALIGLLALAFGWGSGSGLTLSLSAFAALCLLAGELVERTIFFRAVTPWSMPGGMQG